MALADACSSDEVFIVDDDPADRSMLLSVGAVEARAIRSAALPKAQVFLAAAKSRTPTCVHLSTCTCRAIRARHPARSSRRSTIPAPIFIISGQATFRWRSRRSRTARSTSSRSRSTPTTVVTRVREAIEAWARRASGRRDRRLAAADLPRPRSAHPRERDVLGQIAGGASNKEAGRQLGISPRTIEVHRARIMEKLGAKNAADLVRIVLSEGRG